MFGWLRKGRTEDRGAAVDVASLYAAYFALGGSQSGWTVDPVVMAAAMSTPTSAGTLFTEARRIVRISPLLASYLRVMTGGILTGEVERPEFPEGVSERVAAGAADLWEQNHDPDYEKNLLHRVMVDGECLIVDGNVVPADQYTVDMTGPDWDQRVTGYKIGQATTVRSAGAVLYIGDRRMGDPRAAPWIGAALPYAAGLVNARVAAAQGLGVMAKLVSVISNASPDRIAAGAGARSGVVPQVPAAAGERDQLTTVGPGSVPYMKPGEAVARVAAGPDKEAQAYEDKLEADVAGALNMPLSELKSDYRTGSFSNLQMAHHDATAELTRRRTWWYRNFRHPVWRAMLSDAFAAGKLPRMSRADMERLKMPTWPGPVRMSPQPTKDMLAYAKLVDSGVIDAAQAAEHLEL